MTKKNKKKQEKTKERLQILGAAIINSDAAVIKVEAHNIKGSAGNIGAHQMTALCAELEQKIQDKIKAKNIFSQLEQEFKQVADVLNSIRQTGN